MRSKNKFILSVLLLLSVLLQTMPAYATTLENDTIKKVETTESTYENENSQKEQLDETEEIKETKETKEANEIEKFEETNKQSRAAVTGMWGTAPWSFNPETGELDIAAGELGTYTSSPWNAGLVPNENIFKIVFSGKVLAPANSSQLFSGAYPWLNKLQIIENGNNLDTSKVTNMSKMFYGTQLLESVDTSNWDTSSVTNMSGMFVSSKTLRTLDVTNWNTSNVTNMSDLFNGAEKLETLNVTNWDTSNVTKMNGLFSENYVLKEINVSGWKTDKVTDMSSMFKNTKLLENINVTNWNTSNVTNMKSMFHNATSLKNLDVANWDTSKVTDMYCLFYGTLLENINVSNFNMSNVTNIDMMFSNCKLLKELDVSKWDTGKVKTMNATFQNVPLLESIDVSNWNTTNVTKMSYMFNRATSLKNLNVSNWNTSKVTDMLGVFNEASALDNLDVSNWDTNNVINMRSMFDSASSLKEIDVSKWNTSKVTDMSFMFSGTSFKKLDLSNWNTVAVKQMTNMFSKMSSLVTLVLKENFKFTEDSAVPTGKYPYADSWTGENTKNSYDTTSNFMIKYNGTVPDTYHRDILKYDIIYMNGTEELAKDTAISVLDAYTIKDGSAFIIEGKNFLNWNTKEDGTGTKYSFNEALAMNEEIYSPSIVLYADTKDNVYIVTFEPNGGTFTDETTKAKEVTITHGEKVSSEEVTKEGYTFDGWYTDEALTTKYDFESLVTEDVTLYAKWELNKYTVTFEPTGGTFTDETTGAKAVTITHGEKVSAEEVTKEGYTFDGWYTDEALTTKYDFESPVTEGVTLYAKWELNKSTEETTTSGTGTTTTDKNNKEDESGKKKLPKTGMITTYTVLFGLAAIGTGAYLLKNRKEM